MKAILAVFIIVLLSSPREAHPFVSRNSLVETKKRSFAQLTPNPKITDETENTVKAEFLSIWFLSFIHQASMPLSDTIDGVFLSRLDANSLGAIGIAKSAQKSCNKLLHSPLSKVSISMIASAAGKENQAEEDNSLSIATASALSFALFVGFAQLFLFLAGSRQLLSLTGIDEGSSMYSPALRFLRFDVLSIPATTLWLVGTNIFRGLGDASTPIYCAVFLNLVNLCSDFLFIRQLNMGLKGSAIASWVSRTIAFVPMFLLIKRKVPKVNLLTQPLREITEGISEYFKAGILLCGRSIARITAFSYCSRLSARLGPVAASSYSILYQLGFWATMVCEGISIATQALLSRYSSYDSVNSSRLQSTIRQHAFVAGAIVSGSFCTLFYIFRQRILSVFTKNSDIHSAAMGAVPVFILTQLAKGFAFPMNGIVLGRKEWGVSFCTMWAANFACLACLRIFQLNSPGGIWYAWTAYYLGQGFAAFAWYQCLKQNTSKSSILPNH